MAERAGKRFENRDEVREFTDGTGRVEFVDLNGHEIGYVLQGRMLKMDDGAGGKFGAGDNLRMPPGWIRLSA